MIALTNGFHISEDSLLDKLATHIFVVSSYETTNGTQYIYFDELEDGYELEPDFITPEFAEKIHDRVMKLYSEMVGECEVLDDSFSVSLYHDFATGYIEDDQAIEENRRD